MWCYGIVPCVTLYHGSVPFRALDYLSPQMHVIHYSQHLLTWLPPCGLVPPPPSIMANIFPHIHTCLLTHLYLPYQTIMLSVPLLFSSVKGLFGSSLLWYVLTWLRDVPFIMIPFPFVPEIMITPDHMEVSR